MNEPAPISKMALATGVMTTSVGAGTLGCGKGKAATTMRLPLHFLAIEQLLAMLDMSLDTAHKKVVAALWRTRGCAIIHPDVIAEQVGCLPELFEKQCLNHGFVRRGGKSR
jgi:hypothetical protein